MFKKTFDSWQNLYFVDLALPRMFVDGFWFYSIMIGKVFNGKVISFS